MIKSNGYPIPLLTSPLNGEERSDFPPLQGLCRKSVHGSTSSPRTDHGELEISYLAVRPELVEGRAADYDTVSQGEGQGGGGVQWLVYPVQ